MLLKSVCVYNNMKRLTGEYSLKISKRLYIHIFFRAVIKPKKIFLFKYSLYPARGKYMWYRGRTYCDTFAIRGLLCLRKRRRSVESQTGVAIYRHLHWLDIHLKGRGIFSHSTAFSRQARFNFTKTFGSSSFYELVLRINSVGLGCRTWDLSAWKQKWGGG